jgi:nucleoside-diphosphate-sugar epimerase
MTQTVLVLGATGRFGRNMANAFEAAGWAVRRFDRKTDNLDTAALGADVIVQGWHPSYEKWAKEVPGLTRRVIAAARASGVTVLIPGNMYVYGAESPAVITEDTPHNARNLLGKIRVDMEAAFASSGVKTIVLRGGDFLDTKPSGNWFDKIIVKNLHKGVFTYPGECNIPHTWAYLPDMCRAFVMLAEKRATLPVFTTLNYEGYTLSGAQMAKILGVTAKRMNWLPIYLVAPFWKVGRHIIEMRYLWDMPHQVDGAALRALLPEFRETPVNEALHRAASFNINPNEPVIRGRATV